IPDGGPLSSVGRKRGCAMERTTGPSYMEKILKESAEHQWRHFFYGSVKETTDLMIRKIEEKYPGTAVAGVYNPPFRPLSEEEDQKVTRIINESGADFVWIGLGAPKQEIWMYEHPAFIIYDDILTAGYLIAVVNNQNSVLTHYFPLMTAFQINFVFV
nr:WecB/TagA/CpsF family glycosyltransferase [Solobacterium sp.]